MSLRDGTKKMSKSEKSDFSRINLTDNADQIIQKIKKAKTDADPISNNFEDMNDRPEAINLINIYSDLTSTEISKVLNEMGGKNFSDFKKKFSEALVETVCPIGKEIKKLLDDKNYLVEILRKGSEKANLKAEENLKKIREIVGFL